MKTLLATVVPTALLCFACGGGISSNGSDAGPNPTPTPTPVPTTDGGAAPDSGGPVDVPYPAPHGAAPQVISNGGDVMSSVTLVPVFFPNDPMQAQVEQFLKQLAGSSYWKDVTGEYGVGALTIAPSVAVAAPAPATLDDNDIKAWIGAQADGAHAPFPKADSNTLFALFYPQGTSITLQNEKSCQSFGAYHEESSAGGVAFPYAVMPRCGGGLGLTALDNLTVATTHEAVEAATDPFVESNPAFQMTDVDHLLWSYFPGGEVADMCAYEHDVNQQLVGNFMVPRSWSNKSAKAGHDPCVPVLMGVPYFNAAPDLTDTIKLGFGAQSISTKGAKVPIGQTKTVDVRLFSDGPTNGTWTVDALDVASLRGGSPDLQLTLDKPSGKNGDTLKLTIKAIKGGQYGVSMFILRSTLGANEHLWYGAVGN